MLATITLEAFDALDAASAAEWVAPCCASGRWQDGIVAARPYPSLAALSERSDTVLAGLAWDDVLEALAAHPRIGQRAGGNDVESSWSRSEQAATARAGDDVTAQLRAGNIAYEEHFGWVFLICATGKPPEQMLAALTDRLGHGPEAEQTEVREQLRQIVRLRLAKLFGAGS